MFRHQFDLSVNTATTFMGVGYEYKVKISFYTAQYKSIMIVQSALQVIPGRLVQSNTISASQEASSHAAINSQRVFVHRYPPP